MSELTLLTALLKALMCLRGTTVTGTREQFQMDALPAAINDLHVGTEDLNPAH